MIKDIGDIGHTQRDQVGAVLPNVSCGQDQGTATRRAAADLDRGVIEALGARYARGGEAAFDEAASRLVVAVCGMPCP